MHLTNRVDINLSVGSAHTAFFFFSMVAAGYSVDEPLTEEQLRELECPSECPESCSYRSVETKISSSLFLPLNKIGKLHQVINSLLARYGSEKNYTETELSQLTMVELFYESDQQRVVEKTPRMSIEELISNVGGCLGVWSGISFLSIFQILYYCWLGIACKLEKCRSARVVKM